MPKFVANPTSHWLMPGFLLSVMSSIPPFSRALFRTPLEPSLYKDAVSHLSLVCTLLCSCSVQNSHRLVSWYLKTWSEEHKKGRKRDFKKKGMVNNGKCRMR